MDTVKAMCDIQAHGGPDDSGIFQDDIRGVILGHRRLSIVDTGNGGHQPMVYAQRYHLVFNGEIYNYKELRKELLELGKYFTTHSDTEVILAAYAQWGTVSFTKLKGMFAFALWDKQTNELLLVRDPSGIKPLYYFQSNTSFAFSSELKALKQLEGVEEDPNWRIQFMAYGHIPEPLTTLKNVRQLPKGFYIKFDCSDHSFGFHSYSFYDFSTDVTDRKLAVELVQDKLQQAVKRHLVADVPVGVFLSGGTDSAILAALTAQEAAQVPASISLYFSEDIYSEKSYQDILLSTVQMKRHQHLLTQKDFESSLSIALQSMDMPGCDGLNTWFISRFARQLGIKAVISGVGADELFGGYPSFHRMKLALQIQSLPSVIYAATRLSKQKKWHRMAFLRLSGIKGIYLFLRGLFPVPDIARHLGISEAEVWQVLEDSPAMPHLVNLSAGNKASWMELNLYMQNQLLRDTDVMGMAHGVEIRVPFLDDDVVKLAHRLSPDVKFSGREPKSLLTDAFKHLIPSEIYKRPKMGFAFPFQEWFQQSEFLAGKMEGAGVETLRDYNRFMKGNLHWSQMLSLLHLTLENGR